MRSGIRAQLLTAFVGLLLTSAAVEVAWAFNLSLQKAKPTDQSAGARSPETLAAVTTPDETDPATKAPITIVIPLPGMKPFSAVLPPESATAEQFAALAASVSTTIPTTSGQTSPAITIIVPVPGKQPFSAVLPGAASETPTSTAETASPAVGSSSANSGGDGELVFEQPKDYTKLAVEIPMNDIATNAAPAVP